jgi:hypothetical protein
VRQLDGSTAIPAGLEAWYSGFRPGLAAQTRQGKPFAVTEFGCAERGGQGAQAGR